MFSGYPSLADPQAETFNPVVAGLLLAGPAEPSKRWVDTIEVLHLLIGAVALYCLLRGWGMIPAAALLAGIVFMFGGPAAARLQHLSQILTYSYIPLAFLALQKLLNATSLLRGILLGATGGLLLLSLNHLTYLAAWLLGSYFIFQTLVDHKAGRGILWRQWAFGAMAVILALLFAAPQLISTLTLLPLSNRSEFDYQAAMAFTQSPLAFLTGLAPNFFGSLKGHAEFWGPFDITEGYFYIGLVPIAILLALAVRSRLRLPPIALLLFGLFIFFFLYTLGDYNPFSRLFYQLPGVSQFRRPTDGEYMMNLVGALLVGFLFNEFARGMARRDAAEGGCLQAYGYRAVVAGAVFFAGLLLAWGLSLAHQKGVEWSAVKAILAALGLLMGMTIALIGVSHFAARRKKRMAMVAIVFLAIVDVIYVNSNAPFNTARAKAEPEARVVSYLRKRLTETGRWERLHVSDIPQLAYNQAIVERMQIINGYNPLVLRRYYDISGQILNWGEPFKGLIQDYRSPLLDFLNVRYVALGKPLSAGIGLDDPKHWKLLFSDNHSWVYQNLKALPRAFLVNKVKLCENERECKEQLRLNSSKLDRLALVEKSDKNLLGRNMLLGEKESAAKLEKSRRWVKILSYETQQVLLEVENDQEALLVLSDVFFPGWCAEVDGEAVQVLQVNYAFRGIPMTKGRHRVRFFFAPFPYFLALKF